MTTEGARPGRGYIYVEMTIKDPEGFKQYTALSAPAVHAAGGRYIVRGVRPEFLEGSTQAHRIVIVEFGSAAQAREFYHSAAYQAARQKRLSAADFRMTLVEGPPPDWCCRSEKLAKKATKSDSPVARQKICGLHVT